MQNFLTKYTPKLFPTVHLFVFLVFFSFWPHWAASPLVLQLLTSGVRREESTLTSRWRSSSFPSLIPRLMSDMVTARACWVTVPGHGVEGREGARSPALFSLCPPLGSELEQEGLWGGAAAAGLDMAAEAVMDMADTVASAAPLPDGYTSPYYLKIILCCWINLRKEIKWYCYCAFCHFWLDVPWLSEGWEWLRCWFCAELFCLQNLCMDLIKHREISTHFGKREMICRKWCS
jgi:hypothetical protein